jgi:predicted metal-dependent hydrolase
MIEWLRDDYRRPAKPSAPHTIELSGRAVPIALNRHPRAKRLTLRLAPDGSAVRITLPRWCRSADAVAFAKVRREWLEAQLAKVPQAADPIARGTIRYRGEELAIRWAEDAPRKPALEEHAIRLGGPGGTLGPRLNRWLETEAVRLMRADLDHYCTRARLEAPDLRLTRAQRRWGSCSSKGVVRVNWRLVQAPDAIRRSVVAHETAHLVHFDHSPSFHRLLREIYEDDLTAADGWLRTHGRGLYADFG